MACLQAKVKQRPDLCVILGGHKEIITTMNNEYLGLGRGRVHHRFCVHQLASNFNSRFHDKSLKIMLVRAAYERQPREFNHRMERVARVNADVEAWLRAIHLEKWALSHGGGKRFGLMMTNFSKVFNSILKGVQNLSITTCVQMIFYHLNNYFVLRPKGTTARLFEGG